MNVMCDCVRSSACLHASGLGLSLHRLAPHTYTNDTTTPSSSSTHTPTAK